jgi:hypothetical protein
VLGKVDHCCTKQADSFQQAHGKSGAAKELIKGAQQLMYLQAKDNTVCLGGFAAIYSRSFEVQLFARAHNFKCTTQ